MAEMSANQNEELRLEVFLNKRAAGELPVCAREESGSWDVGFGIWRDEEKALGR